MLRKICSYLALFFWFLLGSYQGYIALWTAPNQKPTKVFPYRVESLPTADQEKLAKGIQIRSTEELYQLIQDYLS